MPALNVAASPVAIAPKGPANGPGGATANAADAESGNPFAAMLNEQMIGAGSAAGDAGNASDAPVAGPSAEPAAYGLAALLPALLGTAGSAAGARISSEDDKEDGALAQAELALAMLAPPLAAAAGAVTPGDGAALSMRGRGTAPGPIAGRPAENVPAQPGADNAPAIVAAAADAGTPPRAAADAPRTSGSGRAEGATMAASAAVDKLQREGGRNDTASDVAGIGPDRTLPEQAMVPMHATAASRHAGAESTYHITPALGSRQWESAVGNSLVFMTGQQHSSAELVLTPPQLGRIEISLTVNANNEATATFVSASPAVQEALTNAVPRLKEILADAGITLSQADVNAGTREQSSGGNGESPRRAATADFGGDVAARAVGGGGWSRAGHGLVDVFA